MSVTIFISHSHADKATAFDLEDRIIHAFPGAEVWTDLELRPGRSITAAIEAAMIRADFVALLWTGAASRSTGVADEIALADQTSTPIVPCFYEQGVALPPRLATTLGIDFSDVDSAITQLGGVISSSLADTSAIGGLRDFDDATGAADSVIRNALSRRYVNAIAGSKRVWTNRIRRNQERQNAAGATVLDNLESGIDFAQRAIETITGRHTRADLQQLEHEARTRHSSDPELMDQVLRLVAAARM